MYVISKAGIALNVNKFLSFYSDGKRILAEMENGEIYVLGEYENADVAEDCFDELQISIAEGEKIIRM